MTDTERGRRIIDELARIHSQHQPVVGLAQQAFHKHTHDFEHPEIDPHFRWWSDRMRDEPHMCKESVATLKEGLHAAVMLFHEGKPVAAAGIFNARTADKKDLFFNGMQVVELGSNYVLPEYRHHGLGAKLIAERLLVCAERNLFPISVTTNPRVQGIFKQAQAIAMDTHEQYADMQQKLCLCTKVNAGCKICPMQREGGWVLA